VRTSARLDPFPDFLNALKPEEVYTIVRENSYSQIKCIADNEEAVTYFNDGDKLGYLRKQEFFEGVDLE
jgi:hypothetical protein